MKKLKSELPEEVVSVITKYNNTLSSRFHLWRLKTDAFNEGVLAYYKALSTYNRHKGGDLTKWINLNIWNALNDFYKNEKNIEVTTKEVEIQQELKDYNMDITLCEAMEEVVNQLTCFEQKIYLMFLEGYSLLAISKELKYPKIKIKNIIDTINNIMKSEISYLGFKG